ncbi:MAG: methyltransferase domain-containing protein [Gemmatimonadota bacterium]|nr:MAG: methyltransferase domain-containing protein [Gemmatimonadota bacterium]
MSPIDACPVCEHEELAPVLEVESAPVFCNLLFPNRHEALRAARGTIRLTFCRTCGHLFNSAFEPDRLHYTQSYENSLHYSPRFQEYARSLTERLIAKYDLHDKNVVEIGCGKGDFLELICKLGPNRGTGFDPSYEKTPPLAGAAAQPFQVVQDLYSNKYLDIPADLIVCRHVLEHIARPRPFIDTIRRAIANNPQAAAYFEVPNAMYTIEQLGIWDLIYEHPGYFSKPSLSHLFSSCQLNPVLIEEAFGGQYLCLEAVSQDRTHPSTSANSSGELENAMLNLERFAELHRQKIEYWDSRLKDFRDAERRVVVWGAGSKGVTFLNTVALAESIGYVVDINPRKQGMYTPGTGQPIVAPDLLKEYKPDVILVMNPIYCEEIRALSDRMSLQTEIVPV